MASADFSQFVVTTANETACEISTHKVRALSLHVPAAFTHTSSNFWTSSLLADLSVFLSLICGSCSSGQRFAYSFLQIPPRGGHPCCSAMRFVVAYVRSGLSPVRARPWRAYKSSPRLYNLGLCLHSDTPWFKPRSVFTVPVINFSKLPGSSDGCDRGSLSLDEHLAVGLECTGTFTGKNLGSKLLAELYAFLIEAVHIPCEALKHDLVFKV